VLPVPSSDENARVPEHRSVDAGADGGSPAEKPQRTAGDRLVLAP